MRAEGRPADGTPARRLPPKWLACLALGAAACGPRVAAPDAPPPALLPEPDAEGRAWVERTLASLSLEERVGQLLIPWIPGSYVSTESPEFGELARWVEELGVGGVSISIGLPHSYAAKLNALQARAKVPLLVTADFENGGPGMRINHAYALPSLLPMGGGTSFPPTMAFGAVGDERFAYEYGRITAVEARAVGVHLNFAPVLDVNSNPDNPIINTRAFGEDPEAVARLGVAYIRGAQAGGAMTTAKHFPGHGDTHIDSHLELPEVAADQERLDAVELVPFRAAVDGGVDAVMTAHVSVPGILGPDAPPATLSPYFLTRLLREEMGFRGVLFTDALRMGAITDRYGDGEASLLALEAGADVLLSPGSLEEARDAVLAAVASGRVGRERIDASVRRILELKARAGLHRQRFVSMESLDRVVGSGAHLAFADSAASRAVTLPRDRDGLVPLDPTRTRRVLSVTYGRRVDLVAGRAFDPLLASYVPRVDRVRLEEDARPALYDSLTRAAAEADLVLVNAYVPPQAGAGSVAVPDGLARFVREVGARRPLAVLSFGSPYLLSAFPEVGTYLVAWGDREVAQRAAVRALVGEAAITGRLPTSLPPHHRIGEGLERPAVPRVARLGGERDPLAEAGLVAGRARGLEEGVEGPEAPEAPTEELCRPGPWAPGARTAAGACAARAEMVVSSLEVDPAAVGMSEAGLVALDSLVLAAVEASVTPGAALAVGRRGRLVRLRGYGRLDRDPSSPPATPASLYDVASLTKVVGTTTAAMLLAEEGRLDLDAPVVRYLPWWAEGDPRKERVTGRQLLLHRAGLPPFRRWFLEMEGRAAYQRAMGTLPLERAPGDSTVYSDIGPMTVGLAVETVAGVPLDEFLRRRVWEPLGMQDTGFRPDPAFWERVAPTEVDTVYRHVHVHGVVHDENAYAMGGVAGHAGLFSSARDLAVFAQTLLDGGAVPPCGGEDSPSGTPCSLPRPREGRLASRETIAAFTRRHDATSTRGLGWDTPSPRGSSAGDHLSERAFGHTGFTGTSIWIDPELDLFVVLLTNRVNPTRENQGHVPLRRAVHDRAALSVLDRPAERRR